MNITVFCSSSNKIKKIYKEEATLLGKLIAQYNHCLVYGGNKNGLMGILAKATQSGGSKVVGIISQQIYDMGVVYENLDELIITKDIRERKALLAKKADAFIVLPGGFGTLEEATEVINDKLFGNHNKPILFINTNNYYKDLIQHFNLYKKEGFSRFENENVFFFVENAYLAMKKLSPNKLC